jgi:hypothetical protein
MGEYFGDVGITILLVVFIGIYLISVFMFKPSTIEKMSKAVAINPASSRAVA